MPVHTRTCNNSSTMRASEARSRLLMKHFKSLNIGDKLIVTQAIGYRKKPLQYLAVVEYTHKSYIRINRGGTLITVNVGAVVCGEFVIKKI